MTDAAPKKEQRRKFQAIRGTRDLLPPDTELWNHVEETARSVFGTFGFGEIRPPIFESTDLFARAVGGETDIVSKEMYTFAASPESTAEESQNEMISLRPEATASVCRAYIEHNMQQLPQPVKLYYTGPMFRRERPQKGRYRQFYQIGAEVLENVKPDPTRDAAKELAKDAITDAEVIQMVMTFFDKLKLP
ncbi:MAG TPA: ATP phosphoribosyltransferase regulatory subunit, partial [Candidatus Eremiobacteraceae bacterium]|nr:ATP phosphoribosyltransferase regulatory subunit [Candidatus Eremiobacteraceae bacterium]